MCRCSTTVVHWSCKPAAESSSLSTGSKDVKRMVKIAYADGSGKGWACAMIHSEEGYFKTYFKRISRSSSSDVEFEAILLALEKLVDVEEEIFLFSDSKTAIEHINMECKHNSDVIRHWAQRIRRFVMRNGLEVNFYWTRRDGNMAGIILDSGITSILPALLESLLDICPSYCSFRRKVISEIAMITPSLESFWDSYKLDSRNL